MARPFSGVQWEGIPNGTLLLVLSFISASVHWLARSPEAEGFRRTRFIETRFIEALLATFACGIGVTVVLILLVKQFEAQLLDLPMVALCLVFPIAITSSLLARAGLNRFRSSAPADRNTAILSAIVYSALISIPMLAHVMRDYLGRGDFFQLAVVVLLGRQSWAAIAVGGLAGRIPINLSNLNTGRLIAYGLVVEMAIVVIKMGFPW